MIFIIPVLSQLFKVSLQLVVTVTHYDNIIIPKWQRMYAWYHRECKKIEFPYTLIVKIWSHQMVCGRSHSVLILCWILNRAWHICGIQ